jgi:antitoxin component of MazEF toxin-antitoxin module
MTFARATVVLVPMILVLAVLAGCSGSDGDETAFTPVVGSDTAYCDAYRAWQVHELDGGEGNDQPNPAALRKYWNEYLIFEETLLHEAPAEIRDEVEVKVSGIRTLITPLLEKYDFDDKRLQREGTAAERALFEAPPPELQKAQDAQHAYEERTCGTEPSPPAADVVFEAGGSSKAYCVALDAFNGELEQVVASKFDPDVLEALVTSERFEELLDGLDDTAPAEIAADVEADTEWFRTRWSDVLAEYDYDIRNIYLDATPEDLAVFNRTHPDVREHASRNMAYEEQICEA